MQDLKDAFSRKWYLFLLGLVALILLGFIIQSAMRIRGKISIPSPSPTTALANQGYPSPGFTPTPNPLETSNAAVVAAKMTAAAGAPLTLTAMPAPASQPTFNPTEMAAWVQSLKDRAEITLASNGQTFTFTTTTRFFVFLDDEKYPLSGLKCEPSGVIGYISNGSFRGPDLYPIYYEAVTPGSCMLTEKDFSVKIVVVEPTSIP